MESEKQPGSHNPEDIRSHEDGSPQPDAENLEVSIEGFRGTHTEEAPEESDSDIRDQTAESNASEVFHDADNAVADSPEATPAEILRVYVEQLESDYTQRLAELFASCLHTLDTSELALLHSDEELRNKTAYAIREFRIDRSTLDLGDYYETAYVAHDPEIARRAMELAAKAIQVNESFQAQAADIAQATDSLHLPGSVKDAHRIAEKMEKDYGDDQEIGAIDVDFLASLVKDAARCRIVVSGDPTVADQPIIDRIEESGLTIAEDSLHHPLIKRGFLDRHTGEPLDIEAGMRYRDTKVTVTVTVEVPARDGGVTLCEIAIVTPEMAAATVSEHPIYEITRSLDGDERSTALALLYKLRKIQTEFYGGVSRQIGERVSTT